jgi:hypothetical protein
MCVIYITFERRGPNIWSTTARELAYSAQPCGCVSCAQHCYYAAKHFILAPSSPDLTLCEFFLWGFVKEAVYIWPLPPTLIELKNRITTAVNSVTQDILLRVWDGFSYHLDVIRAAGGGTLNIYKVYCGCNQICWTSYLSIVLCLLFTKLSPYFWITLYFLWEVVSPPSIHVCFYANYYLCCLTNCCGVVSLWSNVCYHSVQRFFFFHLVWCLRT